MIKNILPALVLGLSAIASAAILLVPVHAEDQKAEQVHVRGSIVSYGGTVLKVKTREGETVDVTLADGWNLASVANAAVTDIKPGDFVGIASLPSESGGDGALEVLIFPPAMKGAGEGSYSWDLKPNSSMTNATVADAVKGVDGRTITVSYHGKEKKISIPDGTPVVTIAPATKDDLVPGAVVFIPAEKAASGPLAHQVLVGKNGVVPPM
ncbi:hypothetical protein ELG83_04560 [Rhizobium leguminosarum]|uniref:Conserved hypothetical exported protein n=1 Tax=Rhizobium johnstonii (strain DSM 114642 / LMG 32736 / 3841) TaxID=216596 RepID=Q1MJY7_RHIJ3|nr:MULTISPECIES: hypothetical protein [Rhizobium]NEI94855.1 hypothetical protein [Rhizobium leguminosarum]NEJ81283.1 hypothetical protein [Rhizobium leguminosarum]TBF39365.1 hypothetical protein ELG92_04555 [Rhizobium leguminosarum]TBF51067.1 hypothetical protein ELG91_04630 [Rhizobium leguminosarum]TBF55739.1 hypothetical protein ELG87_04565 [Rhizobium leguminosarum]